jgi:hypothetical protein
MTGPTPDSATGRSKVVWVGLDGRPPRAVWHVEHAGALHVVVDGGEQSLPGARTATTAEVVVRGRASLSARTGTWTAAVERLSPGTTEWDEVVPLLAAARLNAADAEGQPERWARESVVLRLAPESAQE